MKNIQFHPEKCAACSACAIACMDVHSFDPAQGGGPFRSAGEREKNGVFVQFSTACIHCGACIDACPHGCITRDGATGFVLCDSANCTGCRTCLRACPLDAPKFDVLGKMHKCDGCISRVQAGLEPACVRACAPGALSF